MTIRRTFADSGAPGLGSWRTGIGGRTVRELPDIVIAFESSLSGEATTWKRVLAA